MTSPFSGNTGGLQFMSICTHSRHLGASFERKSNTSSHADHWCEFRAMALDAGGQSQRVQKLALSRSTGRNCPLQSLDTRAVCHRDRPFFPSFLALLLSNVGHEWADLPSSPGWTHDLLRLGEKIESDGGLLRVVAGHSHREITACKFRLYQSTIAFKQTLQRANKRCLQSS